jgi:hypothetical protein
MQTSVAPAPRTTRPTAAPPGPSRARLTFELVAIVGAVALAVGLLIVGPFSSGPVGWRTYEDPAGSFELSIPGSYATTTTGNVVRFADDARTPVFSLETYATAATAEQMARSDLQNYGNLTGSELQLVTQRIDGVDAYRIAHQAVGTETIRIYADVPDGVAVMVATAPIDAFDSDMVEDYFGSFELR